MFIDFLKGLGESFLFITGVAIPLGALIGFALYQLAEGDRMRAAAEAEAAGSATGQSVPVPLTSGASDQQATPIAS